MEYDAMSTYREDIAEMISAQIVASFEKALEKEYNRGWDECMKYYWSKKYKENEPYDEDKDPYAG